MSVGVDPAMDAPARNAPSNRPRWRLRVLACGGAVALGVAGALLSGGSATPSATPRSTQNAAASSASETATPPRFVPPTPTKPTLQVNPAAPDYDFERVYRALDGDIVALYEAEPRDAAWATPMEERGTGYLGRDFESAGIKAKTTEVECHTTTCRVVVEAQSRRELASSIAMLQDLRLGDYTAVTGAPEGVEHGIVVYYGFSNSWRDLSRHDQSYRRFRKTQLDVMREIRNQGGSLDYTAPDE